MSRLFIIAVVGFCVPVMSWAQRSEAGAPTQWWLGLKAGMNSTSVAVPESFTVLTSDVNDGRKVYQSSFDRLGYQLAIETSFDIQGKLEIVFQPGIRVLKYGYQNDWLWADSLNETMYELSHEHHQNLTYVDLPLLVKYNFISSGQGRTSIKGKDKKDIKITSSGGFIAFAQGGAFYNHLLSADKRITKTVAQYGTEVETSFRKNISDSFINSSYGWMAGLGLGYDFQSVRVLMDVMYRKGFHNVTRESNRFEDQVLVEEYYDAPDNIKFSNWELNIHVLFPFKFVYGGSFKKL